METMEEFFSELGNVTNRYYKFFKANIDSDLDRDVFFDEILLKCPAPSHEDVMSEVGCSIESARKFCTSIKNKVPHVARYIATREDLLFGLYCINEAAHVYGFDPQKSKKLAAISKDSIVKLEVMTLSDPIFQQGKKQEREDFSQMGAEANGLDYSKEKNLLKELVVEYCADGKQWKTRTEAAECLKDKILACNRNSKARPLSEDNIEKRITDWLSEMEDMDEYFKRGSRRKSVNL